MGIPQHLRLKRAEDFARLRKHGRAFRHPMMILSLASNDLAHNRYGFVTSKHLGKAVQRNHARRVLREITRRLHSRLKPGFDVVFIVREQMMGQSLAAVERIVIELLRRAALFADVE